MKTNIRLKGFLRHTLNKLLFAFFCIVCSSSPAQDITTHNFKIPIEKTYLHLDKAYYTSGEEIWFKVYLVDGLSNIPKVLSEVVYVELINPKNKIVQGRTIKMFNGNGNGNFKLPSHSMAGEYTVRAYTNFMRNFDDSVFFRKKIYVNSIRSGAEPTSFASSVKPTNDKPEYHLNHAKPDIQFFPEGGHMVSGFLNHIAFKAIGPDGKGIVVSGKIVDDSGKKITQFKSSALGLGLIKFIAEEDKNYSAIVFKDDIKLVYELPSILKRGTIMRVVETEDRYRIEIRSSAPKGISDYRILGKHRGELVFDAEINTHSTKKTALLTIPKKELNHGIVQFTLIDGQNRPLAERLVYNEAISNSALLTVFPNKRTYGQRELVELEMALESKKQEIPQANVSMVVADVSISQPQNHALDIKTYLMLTSELKGEIEQPGYYFYSADANRKANLDLLMMTHGWRKYLLEDYSDSTLSKIKFLPERGLSLKGRVKNPYDSEKSIISDVSLVYRNDEETGLDRIKTDEQGRFNFRNLNFFDTTSVVLRSSIYQLDLTSKRKGSTPNGRYSISVDSLERPKVSVERTYKAASKINRPELYVTDLENTEHNGHSISSIDKTIQLEEITVEAAKNEKQNKYTLKRASSLYKSPSHTIDFKDIQTFPTLNILTALVGRLPGYSLYKDGPVLRGFNSLNLVEDNIVKNNIPLFLLNGVPIEGIEAITEIPIQDVDFVDVLSSSRSAIYGSAAGNGVIAIYTLDGQEKFDKKEAQSKNRTSLEFSHPGFDRPKKFYEPLYHLKTDEKKKLDYRTTLSWRPNIQLTKDGTAKVSFYTSDKVAEYKVVLEGLTSDGIPLRSETVFEVIEKKDP